MSTSSASDLEVTLDWEEVPKESDDWTEARRKQTKKIPSSRRDGRESREGRGGREGREGREGKEGRERRSGKALAGTDGNGGRREGRGKRSSRKRDQGVRDMKPRPCHTYYLSESPPLIPSPPFPLLFNVHKIKS